MNAPLPAGIRKIVDLYDELVADRDAVAAAPVVSDPALAADVALFLTAKARMLDSRAFDKWLALWEPDAACWVPLATGGHPGKDQALYLDDYRRLGERVWRMGDKSAWALWPAAETLRAVAGVEAWRLDELDGAPEAAGPAEEILAASSIHIHYVRTGQVVNIVGRQIHRLRRSADGWRIRRKTMLFPQLVAGSPHLGWLL